MDVHLIVASARHRHAGAVGTPHHCGYHSFRLWATFDVAEPLSREPVPHHQFPGYQAVRGSNGREPRKPTAIWTESQLGDRTRERFGLLQFAGLDIEDYQRTGCLFADTLDNGDTITGV